MTKNGLKPFKRIMTTIFIVVFAVSCLPSTSKNSLRGRAKSGMVNNANLKVGEGQVLLDNPIVLSNNANFDVNSSFNAIISGPVHITTNSFLQSHSNCAGIDYCFQVLDERTSPSALQSGDGKWGYNFGTEEFNQVQLFYHISVSFDRFLENILGSVFNAYQGSAIPLYDTALPSTLINTNGTFNVNNSPLIGISNCDNENNANFENDLVFDKTTNLLCFGFTNTTTIPLRWVHDSSIIYHEGGHFFQSMQLNFRNLASSIKTDLGSVKGYDEAGSLGEGLADYYSYYINGRTHLGEWAAGRYLGASRPITETDNLHYAPVSADRDERLYYPEYINYEPNFPGIPVEDVHAGGMVASHYLVALTEDLQLKCSMTKKEAQENVMHLISETLAELGDLTSVGTKNGAAGKVNLNASYSKLWFETINPINYRSFFQTMAKNLLINLGNPLLNRCGGTYYKKDDIESLLDDYGLLLFKTYNQHRNLTNGTTKVNTAVTATNRKKSVMVPKSAIIFDPAQDASIAFVIDAQATLKSAIGGFKAAGLPFNISPQIGLDLPYNNGNSKISPGEVVAVALNLYNNSNTTIAGVQILANEWDQADTTVGANFGRPCQFSASVSNDTWPLESEGGSTAPSCSSIGATAADFAPVCFIQYNEASATKWISQKEFREKIALDNNFCLDPSNTAGADKDCFIRAVKGLDTATYSKINPKSTWGKTFADPKDGTAPDFDYGNLFFLEVSKHVPPGTVIDCRVRVRFTNCEDCFHDSSNGNNDFKDVDYNGPKPYKVLHLQFPVTD